MRMRTVSGPTAAGLPLLEAMRHAVAMAQSGNDGASNDGDSAKREPYQVVARRFRPQTFDELVGQDEVVKSLRVALEQGRVPHAFVFSGSRGVGKTTSARILARCMNCKDGPTPTPCGTCDSCKSILDGSNPDVTEVDAASHNGVDDVRRLRESLSYAAMQSRYRVVILDEAHMMSKAAFNALLKTLEEPPPKVLFVLATTELHKLPDTIRSRCQVLSFKRVGEQDLEKRLRMIADKDGVAVPDEVLAEIAASVHGGVRDAETALERVLPLARDLGDKFDLAAYLALTSRVGTDAVIDVVAALLSGDAKKGLHFVHDLQQQGMDEREALGEIVDMLRWVMLMRVDGEDSVLVPLTGEVRKKVFALAGTADGPHLDAMIGAGVLARARLRRREDRSAVFEVAMLRMAQAGSMPTLADLLAEVRAGSFRGQGLPGQGRPGQGVAGQPASPQGRATGGAPPRQFGKGAAGGRSAQAPPARQATPVVDAKDLKSRVMVGLEKRKLLQATMELCRVEGPDDKGRVVVTLETERKLHRDRLSSTVIQQELKDAIHDAAGRAVTVDFRIGSEDGGSTSLSGGAAKPPPPEAKPGDKAKGVMKKFGGRVVQVNPQDRVQKPKAQPAVDEALDSGAPPSGD